MHIAVASWPSSAGTGAGGELQPRFPADDTGTPGEPAP